MSAIISNRVFAASIFFLGLLAGCASQAQLAKPNTTVTLEGTDENRRSATVEDLVTIRDIGPGGFFNGVLSVSPGGDEVAFYVVEPVPENGDYKTGWFVASTDPTKPNAKQIGDGGDVILQGFAGGRVVGSVVAPKVIWSADGRFVIYSKKEGEEVQLWMTRSDGDDERQLTYNRGDVLDYDWSSNSNELFFMVGQARDARTAALENEGQTGYLFDERFLVLEDNKPLFAHERDVKRYAGAHESGLWVLNLETGVERIANESENQEYLALKLPARAEHLRDERLIRLSAQSKQSSYYAWFEVKNPEVFAGPSAPLSLFSQTNDHEDLECDHDECHGHLSDLIWNDSAGEVVFLRKEGVNGTHTGVYAWTPETGAIRTVIKTPDLLLDCERSRGTDMTCVHESATSPRRLVSVDLTTGEIAQLFDPNPEFASIGFTKVEFLRWQEKSGADAAGHLVYPVNYQEGVRYPLVIVQYRSKGFLRGGVGDEYPIHPLAAHGFFVLSFERPDDVHKLQTIADTFERERALWGDEMWERESAVSALEIVVNQLSERGLIDSSRVGVTGLSDGADTLWYALIHSDFIAAAAASSGTISPSWFYLGNAAIREKFLEFAAELAPPETGGDARWRRVAPELNAEKINVPILVQVADKELSTSAGTINALTAANRPIETFVFPNEYHVKWQPQHKLAVYNRTIDWFNFWLQDSEDSDPAKAEQYERWRELRILRDENAVAIHR